MALNTTNASPFLTKSPTLAFISTTVPGIGAPKDPFLLFSAFGCDLKSFKTDLSLTKRDLNWPFSSKKTSRSTPFNSPIARTLTYKVFPVSISIFKPKSTFFINSGIF